MEYKERSKEEFAKLENMIRSSVGFDEKRGDTLSVTNMQFSPEFSGFKSESVMDWIKEDLQSIIQIMVMGLVAILVILMVIRPLVKRAIEINVAQQGLVPDMGEQPFGLLPSPYAISQIAGGGGAAGAIAGVSGAAGGAKQIAGTAGGDSGYPGDANMEGSEGFSILGGMQSKNKPSSVKQLNDIISNNPQDALAALRAWMYGEAAA
jgi:flagellar M-ring protein FliF